MFAKLLRLAEAYKDIYGGYPERIPLPTEVYKKCGGRTYIDIALPPPPLLFGQCADISSLYVVRINIVEVKAVSSPS